MLDGAIGSPVRLISTGAEWEVEYELQTKTTAFTDLVGFGRC